MDISNFTESAKAILTNSSTLAIQNQNKEITDYHFLMIMLERKENFIYQVLVELGIDVSRVCDLIGDELAKLPVNEDNSALKFSIHAEKTLEESEKIAKSMKESFIAPEHLLLAMLEAGPETLQRIFKLFSITKHKIIGALKGFGPGLNSEDEEENRDPFKVLSKYGEVKL